MPNSSNQSSVWWIPRKSAAWFASIVAFCIPKRSTVTSNTLPRHGECLNDSRKWTSMSNRSDEVEHYKKLANHWEVLCLHEKNMMLTYMIETARANKGIARKNRRIRTLIEQMWSEAKSFLRIAEKFSASIKHFNDDDLARMCMSVIHGKPNMVGRHIARHKVDGLMIEGGSDAVAIASIVEAARRYCKMIGVIEADKKKDEELLKQFPQIELFEQEVQSGQG